MIHGKPEQCRGGRETHAKEEILYGRRATFSRFPFSQTLRVTVYTTIARLKRLKYDLYFYIQQSLLTHLCMSIFNVGHMQALSP